MSWQPWFNAFLMTEALELPIWLAATRHLPVPRALAVAFGSSMITHPIVWYAFPWDHWAYAPTVVFAEAFAVVGEALFAKALGVRHPWWWSLAANATSASIGLLLQVVG